MVEGFSITLEMIDRHQSGVYQCTASNGVGDPVTVDMQLDVLCKHLKNLVVSVTRYKKLTKKISFLFRPT